GNRGRRPPTTSSSSIERPAACSASRIGAISSRVGCPKGWKPWPCATKRPDDEVGDVYPAEPERRGGSSGAGTWRPAFRATGPLRSAIEWLALTPEQVLARRRVAVSVRRSCGSGDERRRVGTGAHPG